MRIPEIRARMIELAELHGIPELAELAAETKRRPPIRRAAKRWPRLTDEQREDVRKAFFADESIGVRELADHFSTSVGRVSEAIRGFRT